MNKKFYFALALTAGLFASCSSDDLTADSPDLNINNSEETAIKLLVGNPSGTTRGTGTVGDVAGNAANKWGGQKFNIFMLKKGTMDLATEKDATDPTVDVPIYDNAVFYAPNEINGANSNQPAMEVTEVVEGSDGLVVKSNVSYFPQSGNYDFWAYRLDDAKKPGTADPYEVTEGASKITAAFEIDGSQDIMVAKAVPDVDENTGDDAGTYGTEKVPEARIFSAYSNRRDVYPMLKFQHQLARLQFKIKAKKASLSDACEDVTDATKAVVPNEYAVKVTALKIKSRYQGTLNIAYTADATPDNIIEWDNAETDLALKQRSKSWTKAVLGWASANAAFDTDVNCVNADDNTLVKVEHYTGATKIYTAAEKANLDVKGMPVAAGVAANTVAAADLANYYICGVITNPIEGPTSVSQNMDPLDPVAPVWDGTTDEAYATPVGEALLVAPMKQDGDYYELEITTSQTVPTEVQRTTYTIAQALGGNAAVFNNEDVTATYDSEAAFDAAVTAGNIQSAGKGDAAAYAAAGAIEDNDDKYFFDTENTKCYHIVLTTPSSNPDYTYYFASAADAAAAVTAYNAWKADPTDAKAVTKDAALAKGTQTQGGVVEVVLDTKPVVSTKRVKLYGPSTPAGNSYIYGSYKAGHTYTITLTLDGVEKIAGDNDNIADPTYEVETGNEINQNVDEMEEVNP